MTLNQNKPVKRIIALVIILALLIISGMFSWNIYLRLNPHKAFVNSIAGELKNYGVDKSKLFEGAIKENGSLTVSGKDEAVESSEMLELANISWNGSSDVSKLEAVANFIITSSGTKYLDTNVVTTNGKIFVNFKDKFEKYIEIGSKVDSAKIIYTADEMDKIKEHVLIVLKDSIRKDYFKNENIEVTEGKKKEKLNTIILELDEKSIKAIAINVVQNIREDGYLVTELAKTNEITKIAQEEELDKVIKEMQDSPASETGEKVTISASTGFFGELKQLKITSGAGFESVYKKYSDTKEINVKNATLAANIKSVENKKDTVTTLVVETEGLYVKGELLNKETSKTSSEGTYNLYFKDSEAAAVKNYEIKGTYTSSNSALTKSNKAGAATFNMDTTFEQNASPIFSLNTKYSSNQEKTTKVELPNLSNTVNYEDLTETDYEALSKIELFNLILQSQSAFAGLFSNGIVEEAEYSKIENDKATIEEMISMQKSTYYAESSKRPDPVFITEGTPKEGELKIDMSAIYSEGFKVSSSGKVTYSYFGNESDFKTEYGLKELPEWVVFE